MNRNNDVFAVLVTKGNVAIKAKDAAIDTLAVGQIGFFDATTHLTIDATTTPMPPNIYIAVGVNRTGAGGGATFEDARLSAGQRLPVRAIGAYTFEPHGPGRPMIVTVAGYEAYSNTDYTIRIEFRNSRIYKIQGYNQFSAAYTVTMPCAAGTAPGSVVAIDANKLTMAMVDAINKDPNQLVKAEQVAAQALTALTHGTSVDYALGAVMTDADVNALLTYNANPANAATKVYTSIKLTSVPLKIGAAFCGTNLGYNKLLETVLVVSLVDGFSCGTTNVISQYPMYAQGSSANIKQKEYHASAWAGAGPYVLSDVTGTAMNRIEYLTQDGVNYDQSILQYEDNSESGWQDYTTTLATIIAVPATDTVTRASLALMLDALTAVNGMPAQATYVGTVSNNPATPEVDPTNYATDGIVE
jgi:hypothetical protein